MRYPSRSLVPFLSIALAAALVAPASHAQAAGAAGSAGSASGGTSGAAAQGGAASGQSGQAAAQPGAKGGAPQPDVSQAAAAYAAGAAPGTDPRMPPKSRPGALTLQQVLERARANNPTLRSAQQNLNAVRAQEIQAGVRANPYIGVAGSNLTEPQSVNNPYALSFQVSRLFERGNKREYRLQTARATTEQTQATLADTIRQTELAVRQAFTTMLVAKEAMQLSEAQLVDFRHEVEIGHDRYLAGDLGKLDFERLDLQLGSFESDEQNDEITMEQASDHLQTLMGIATPSTDFDVLGQIVPPPVLQTREQLQALAVQQRPDLIAAQAAIREAEAASRLAIANGTTDPTLEAEYDRNGTENSVGFNANIPLRLFDRNQGNKATAKFQADAAVLAAQATRNQVQSDVSQAWSAYTHAKVLSTRFGEHYLDESSDVLSIARYAFDHGGIALIDYLDALRDARSSTSDALNAYSLTWMAIHQLSAATATDVAP